LSKTFNQLGGVLVMMDLDLWDPFRGRKRRFPSLLDEFFTPTVFEDENKLREPLVDVVDKGDKYELTAELPGIKKEDLDINVDEHAITLKAEQKHYLKEEDKKEGHYYCERSYSSFFRRIPLAEKIVPDKTNAELKNGVLQLELVKEKPTEPEKKSFKVEVK
jgi:HSP20 family molecular chaperone IbpA